MLNHVPKLGQIFIIENLKSKFQNFGPNYAKGNRERDAHCEFHQHRSMMKCSKLERNRDLWHPSRKSGATTNFEQKYTMKNRGRNTHRKFHQNGTTLKCSKLREKKCGRRCEMPEGVPALEPNITDFKVPLRLKLWDDIAEILPYMNFQGNQNRGKALMRLANNAL